jgi:XapX domain-containing protein
MTVSPYVVSLGIGLGVGVIYALLGTRSPAPPVIALLGLLGMLAGETAVNWAKDRMSVQEAATHCLHGKSFGVASDDKGPQTKCGPASPETKS